MAERESRPALCYFWHELLLGCCQSWQAWHGTEASLTSYRMCSGTWREQPGILTSGHMVPLIRTYFKGGDVSHGRTTGSMLWRGGCFWVDF